MIIFNGSLWLAFFDTRLKADRRISNSWAILPFFIPSDPKEISLSFRQAENYGGFYDKLNF